MGQKCVTIVCTCACTCRSCCLLLGLVPQQVGFVGACLGMSKGGEWHPWRVGEPNIGGLPGRSRIAIVASQSKSQWCRLELSLAQ